MSSFETIGIATKTDKISHHGYHRFYPRYLDKYRDQRGNLLEIGIDRSCSLRLWQEYLPLFHITGLDIGLEYSDDRSTVYKCDQSNLPAVATLLKDCQFDIVVDDGSHHPAHQLMSFDNIFDHHLTDGGVYIIEDIETNYWRHGELYGNTISYGYQYFNSCVEIFKNLIDVINIEFLHLSDRQNLQGRLKDKISLSTQSKISSITFGHNCIIITKKSIEEYQYANRDYRFAYFVK